MAVNKIILNGEEIELSDEQARRIIGSGTLATVAQTLIGGVNELDSKVGKNNLLTTAQTLIGGVNELDSKIGDGILTTDNKALIGSVNELNEKISVINDSITSGGNSSGYDDLFKFNGSTSFVDNNNYRESGYESTFNVNVNPPNGYKFFMGYFNVNYPFIKLSETYKASEKKYVVRYRNISNSGGYFSGDWLPIFIKKEAIKWDGEPTTY